MLRARVKILCGLCGGDTFDGPRHPQPNDILYCKTCRSGTSYSQLEADSIARTKRVADLRQAGKLFNRH
jgi:hypothetical protein